MSRSAAMGPVAVALRRPSALSPPRSFVAKSLAAEFVRHYGAPSGGGLYSQRSMVGKMMGQSAQANTKEMRVSEGQKLATEMLRGGNGPLYPATFVSLPIAQYPRKPRDWWKYSLLRLQAYGTEWASVLRLKMQSMASWTKRPQWKAQRGRISPTAKAMYREVLEAFAAGDKTTLNKICQPMFSSKLNAAIDRRSAKTQTKFQLVKYNKPWRYPRLASHQIQPSMGGAKNALTEQAIVAIASTQQVQKCDAVTGQVVEGSVKVQDKVEYVVLTREVNSQTFEKGTWRVWGTTTATSLEQHIEETKKIEQQISQHLGMKKNTK